MYYRSFLICFLFLLLLTRFAFADGTNPALIDVPVTRAFVPVGFDSNDRSQAAVTGTFPNTCYKVGPLAVEVDPARKIIAIRQKAYVYFGYCLQVVVPFGQTVDLGVLRAGNYLLKDATTDRELGKLDVKPATHPEPDDYLYMPVSEAYVRKEGAPPKATLVLEGNASGCFQAEKPIVSDYGDVIVVQPVAKALDPVKSKCHPEEAPFSMEIPLTSKTKGPHLVHVRSLNGQGINKVVELP